MRILFMSNSAIGRWGYAIVGSKVADALQEAGHQVIYLGLQTLAPPYKLDNGIVAIGIRYDATARDALENYTWIYRTNLLLTMFDVWREDTYHLPQICRQQRMAWLAHATVFTDPISPFLRKNIEKADMIVAPSLYNQDALKAASLGEKTRHIPHGVDLDIFSPLGKKKRNEWRERLQIEKDAFVALSVMRNNHPGKNYPALFKAWKKAREEREFRENAKLLVLADPVEIKGLRLDVLRKMHRLEDSVKFIWARPSDDLSTLDPTYEKDRKGMPHHANIGFTADRMAFLYNLADVHVSSSMGESFGLPHLEAQACGVPCIATSFSTGRELVGAPNAGLLAQVAAMTTHPVVLGDMAEVDVEDLAEVILVMYEHKDKRRRFSRNALKNAKNYSLDKILPQWVSLVNEIEENIVLRTDYSKGRLGI